MICVFSCKTSFSSCMKKTLYRLLIRFLFLEILSGVIGFWRCLTDFFGFFFVLLEVMRVAAN